MDRVRGEIERTFRDESGKVLSGLVRVCGDIELAHDAVQEAFVVALARWPDEGIPDRPFDEWSLWNPSNPLGAPDRFDAAEIERRLGVFLVLS